MSVDEIDLIKRILNGFKHYGCFIFEKKDLESVRRVVKNTSVDRLLTIKRADPRYDHIYILIPWKLEYHQDCESRIRKMLAEGSINRDLFKKNYPALIDQCVSFYERETIREVVRILEEYLKSREKEKPGEESNGNKEATEG